MLGVNCRLLPRVGCVDEIGVGVRVGRARDRVRKSRKKFRDAQPSMQVIEHVRPFTTVIAGPDDDEELAAAAAIVWEGGS